MRSPWRKGGFSGRASQKGPQIQRPVPTPPPTTHTVFPSRTFATFEGGSISQAPRRGPTANKSPGDGPDPNDDQDGGSDLHRGRPQGYGGGDPGGGGPGGGGRAVDQEEVDHRAVLPPPEAATTLLRPIFDLRDCPLDPQAPPEICLGGSPGTYTITRKIYHFMALITIRRSASIRASATDLARQSPALSHDVARFGWTRWTGSAKTWWNAMTHDAKNYLEQDWSLLLAAIIKQFLGDKWLQDKGSEFAEMRFWDSGHASESPVDFLQRKIRLYRLENPSVSFTLQPPGAADLTSYTQSYETRPWKLLSRAREQDKSLVAIWGPRRTGFQSFRTRTAHATESENPLVPDFESSSSESGTEAEAMSVQKPMRGKTGSRGKGRSAQEAPLVDKSGKPRFSRDDSVVSKSPPPGPCRVCASPKHWDRDCPHYGHYTALRSANLIEVDLDPEEEARRDVLYVQMMEQSERSVAQYPVVTTISESKKGDYSYQPYDTGEGSARVRENQAVHAFLAH
ncbi:hypothetical protein PLICRDRAFT_175102 [Plicaturopsis crispa FD-325 SS-3]|nr:hypothetical protein PLICRDRAFT_175102 [Plicaturopsis crispa FD-325 SS-3]